MNIFKFAMQMEKDGEDYYRSLAQQAGNKGLKTIFTMLADEEVKHYKVVQQMMTQKPRMTETTILTGVKNVFAQIKESNQGFNFDARQTELYRKAQDIERNSREFYLQKADEVQQEYHKEIFLKLAEQENKHFFLLENIIQFVSRPEHWLENAEFYHLDEY